MSDLHDGKIETFEVTKEEFMDFQKVFMESNFRKKVIGKAKRCGGAIYHYDKGDEF